MFKKPTVSLISDFALVDRAYNLSETLAQAVRDGAVSPAITDAGRAEQALLSRAGGFL